MATKSFLSILSGVILQLSGILVNQSYVTLIVLHIIFLASCITFALLFTPFFKTSASGTSFALITFMITALPGLYFKKIPGSFLKGLTLLLSPAAYNVALQIILEADFDGVTVDFTNWGDATLSSQGASLFEVLIFIIVDIFFYILMGWYFDQVVPNGSGIKKVPWFFLTSNYWEKKGIAQNKEVLETRQDENSTQKRSMTNRSTSRRSSNTVLDARTNMSAEQAKKLKPGIQIKNVSKRYNTASGTTFALNDLSIDFHENEIVVLLGHNGAGYTYSLFA